MTTGNSGYKAPAALHIFGIQDIPEIKPGDDLGAIILQGVQTAGENIEDGDVIVVAQKIVSKAEGRMMRLSDITPSDDAIALARETEKDPHIVELVLRESVAVVAQRPGVLIVETPHGLVLANAGIDRSNVAGDGDDEMVLLLPENPDASAAAIRSALGGEIPVIINDSLGRAWRNGTIGTAIGAAGLSALLDMNGAPDMQNRPLQATQIGLADELAAAASVVMGQADEARPVAVIRGLSGHLADGSAADLVRPKETDLFR